MAQTSLNQLQQKLACIPLQQHSLYWQEAEQLIRQQRRIVFAYQLLPLTPKHLVRLEFNVLLPDESAPLTPERMKRLGFGETEWVLPQPSLQLTGRAAIMATLTYLSLSTNSCKQVERVVLLNGIVNELRQFISTQPLLQANMGEVTKLYHTYWSARKTTRSSSFQARRMLPFDWQAWAVLFEKWVEQERFPSEVEEAQALLSDEAYSLARMLSIR